MGGGGGGRRAAAAFDCLPMAVLPSRPSGHLLFTKSLRKVKPIVYIRMTILSF